MNTMTTEKRVCIFEVHAYSFQKDCVPYPSDVVKAIDEFMPRMAVSRNEKLQETMRVSPVYQNPEASSLAN